MFLSFVLPEWIVRRFPSALLILCKMTEMAGQGRDDQQDRFPMRKVQQPAAGQTKPGPQKNHLRSAGTVPHHPRRDSRIGPDTAGASVSRPPIWGSEPSHRGCCRHVQHHLPTGERHRPTTGTPSLPFSARDRPSGWPWPAGFRPRRCGLRTPSRHSWRDSQRESTTTAGCWLGAAWRPGGHVLVLEAPRPCCGIAASGAAQ